MSHLIIVVLSIALLSIVIAGGVNYLHSDIGVRTESIRQISTSRHAIETALAAYHIANRGASPPESLGHAALGDFLQGYLVHGWDSRPQGTSWRYDIGGPSRILCLGADDGVSLSPAVLKGMESFLEDDEELSSRPVLADGCGDEVTLEEFRSTSSPSIKFPVRIAE